jgi:UPF0755 protein
MKPITFFFAILFLFAGAFLALFVPAAWLSQPSASAPKLSFSVSANATAAQVAHALVDKGAETNTIGYRIYALVDPTANRAREGTYSIQPGMSYRTLARLFALGPARDEVELKVIEGWSIHDIADMLQKSGITSNDVFAVTGDVKTARAFDPSLRSEYPFLASLSPSSTLEGYLFPDTYRVWKDQLPQSLIKKQLDAFGQRATEIAEDAKAQGRTLNEVVTLASILEKEVTTSEDRKIVAGIFMNRLRDGMALQSDATVNYVTGAGRTRPTAQDLATASPYNTYRNKGFPPGPISNPGDDALDAALHPAATEYRFFLTDADGKVYYAKTLEEHIRNKVKAFGR